MMVQDNTGLRNPNDDWNVKGGFMETASSGASKVQGNFGQVERTQERATGARIGEHGR